MWVLKLVYFLTHVHNLNVIDYYTTTRNLAVDMWYLNPTIALPYSELDVQIFAIKVKTDLGVLPRFYVGVTNLSDTVLLFILSNNDLGYEDIGNRFVLFDSPI